MFYRYLRYFIIRLLQLYQRTLSFDHGILKIFYPHGFCRFQPTCSDYAISAISQRGLIRGGIKALWRVLRCHPWSKGGWDPAE